MLKIGNQDLSAVIIDRQNFQSVLTKIIDSANNGELEADLNDGVYRLLKKYSVVRRNICYHMLTAYIDRARELKKPALFHAVSDDMKLVKGCHDTWFCWKRSSDLDFQLGKEPYHHVYRMTPEMVQNMVGALLARTGK